LAAGKGAKLVQVSGDNAARRALELWSKTNADEFEEIGSVDDFHCSKGMQDALDCNPNKKGLFTIGLGLLKQSWRDMQPADKVVDVPGSSGTLKTPVASPADSLFSFLSTQVPFSRERIPDQKTDADPLPPALFATPSLQINLTSLPLTQSRIPKSHASDSAVECDEEDRRQDYLPVWRRRPRRWL
jgi:hypothetical protein